ncbi:mitochondrial ribosomal protein S25-domain-containing protein [Cristinia sonorae]|uniref:Small ribosomal subunit protein mS23 n=1 Tax=Cristinia sonorae TaxID=1940300 RepID=A0A8K0UL81_9AGAR|nr:mitochondrial ribosomal protein S25-domain-containing protein [Cristinia sonorae]
MPRRFAGQVHKQASRFLRSNLLKKEPVWYQAVLENPPLPLPPRAPAPRSLVDTPHRLGTSLDPTIQSSITRRPLPIRYIEDTLRQQFFEDHPFEAFRPVSLIEGARIEDEHPIKGKEWLRLRQRGRNPTPEDAIRYAANLHEHRKVPLTQAYASAVAQFRALRAERDIAISTALREAKAYGIQFGPSDVDITFRKEDKALNTWEKKDELDASALAARKRWKAIVEKEYEQGKWSKGKEYVRLWKEGVRPDYLPVLKQPVITSAGLESVSREAAEATAELESRRAVGRSVDWMNTMKRAPLS